MAASLTYRLPVRYTGCLGLACTRFGWHPLKL